VVIIMNDNIENLVQGILMMLFGILTIVFILIYISIGNGNGIFEPMETILLILALLSFLSIFISNFLFQQNDSQTHGIFMYNWSA